ncbi:MAG: prepilin-type N-terminal cleavage/methylation domain-containing protein [Candidatus Omnitrophota bacterium]
MNKRGFTLIEAIASVLLIGVAIVPIAKILTQSFVISTKEERFTKVVFLAERKIEEVKNKALYDFNTDRDQSATAFTDTGFTNYKYTVADNIIEDDDSALKQIQVIVWHDEDNDNAVDANEESITLDTKIAER